MLREIIEIDEDLCIGCGNCVPNCHQGALQIIDGKARLISDLMCEGIGVCVGHCPTGAMTIEKREAESYDERKVMQKICGGGANVIIAHLEHLEKHRQNIYLEQALAYLKEHDMTDPRTGSSAESGASEKSDELSATTSTGDGRSRTITPIPVVAPSGDHAGHRGGCPGSMARSLPGMRSESSRAGAATGQPAASELRQWPVQLHLLNPAAGYVQNADVLLAADCVAFAMGDFHERLLKGKTLAIACPKLDDGLESYVDKLTRMIDEASINTLTVAMMEVPCCGGLLQIAQAAVAQAKRPIPIKQMVVSLEGEVLREGWVL
jgi:ferredoxin